MIRNTIWQINRIVPIKAGINATLYIIKAPKNYGMRRVPVCHIGSSNKEL